MSRQNRTNVWEKLDKPKAPIREIKYYGSAACLEIWRTRPDDVIRLYLSEERTKQFGPVMKGMAAQRKAYHVVENEDLEKLTESIHHQGVCLLAREKAPLSFTTFKDQLTEHAGPQLLVYLDGVENPHNLGAIVRSCAHFGVPFVLGASGQMPSMSPSACRVAEGGAEHVELVVLNQPDKQLAELREMGFVITTTAADGKSVYQHEFPKRTLLVMGAEQTGVSKACYKLAQTTLAIPGTGHVDSLNVSVAFAVIASECKRKQLGLTQKQGKKPKIS